MEDGYTLAAAQAAQKGVAGVMLVYWLLAAAQAAQKINNVLTAALNELAAAQAAQKTSMINSYLAGRLAAAQAAQKKRHRPANPDEPVPREHGDKPKKRPGEPCQPHCSP